MGEDRRYAISGPHVVHEIVEKEALVINMQSGVYYGLRGAAAEIWSFVGVGLTAQEMSAHFTVNGLEDPAIADNIEHFLKALEGEALVVWAEANGQVAARPEGARLPFEEPVFEKYTDMESFLQVDPVHEIGEMGWPQRPRDKT